jgi:CRISPR-associated endonuclease Csn1
LRGYSGGNGDDDKTQKKKQKETEESEIKKYEVITQKVEILKVEESDKTFKVRGGKNKGQELNKVDVTIRYDDEELEGETELQNLKEKEGQEEELEIRIKRTKKGEVTSVVFTLPQKTNWRKQMEKTEEDLKKDNLHVSQLILRDLHQNKWTKIRNRTFLRQRYQAEFDAIWETQSKAYSILNECPKETVDKIANYIFPGKRVSQEKLRQAAITGGLKYIIKDQVIYYQRPLKPQTELVGSCQFEKDEKVLPNSHPLFQEFRCWDQINRMYITSKQEVYNERKKKNVFQYTDRFLTPEEKQEIYNKLQTQKQLGFSEVAKIIKLKNDKTEYLNGLNVKSKLKGCDTQIAIKKILREYFDTLYTNDKSIIEKIWKTIFDNANNGSEYDPNSLKVSSIKKVLTALNNDQLSTELALRFAQGVKFPRKYASLSEKAIINILPLMQLNSTNVLEKIKNNFSNIQHLIDTGEILDETLLEKYVISFVKNNPKALETGGLMYAFASSLVYGKHTQETIKPQYKDYHQIKYEKRNLRNPIVEQLTNETMQVVKAIWKEYKFNPEELEIRIELARDLKNSAAERDKIYKAQRKNENTNRDIKERLQAEGIPVTDKNVLKYKLYVQQNFISPYTKNEIIPLSSLFDERLYDIDHIVPKSRYFDDSISNKIICETYINEEKSNRTAWEYISQQNSKFETRSIEDYVSYVNDTFYGKKKKNLLLERIPTNPVERQIKDTQYISVAVKNELAKVVGSEKVKTSTGEVTDFLRSRWGLKKLFMELTENRFKLMELWDWNKESNQPNRQWIQKYFDKENQKHIYEIKHWSKRYDHRHHAIDALVVALTEQSHIQRLNNLNKYLQDELTKRKNEFKIEVKDDETILEAFFNLEEKRRKEIQEQIESSRYFQKPFDDLINQAKTLLETIFVSIKPKDKLGISVDKFDHNTPNKQLKKQIKIRGALHQETNYGKTKDPKTGLLRDTKTVELKDLSAKDIQNIIDKVLREIEIPLHRKKFESMKEAFTGEGLKLFNESRFQSKKPDKLKPPVYKVKIWYSTKEDEESTLQRLYDGNNKLTVVTGDNYLFMIMEKNGKRIFDIASLYDSADIAKRTVREKDENYKEQICQDFRIKHKEKPDKVLFTLQQNDLVFLPENADDPILKFNDDELKLWLSNIENKKSFSRRTYKVAKFTGKDCFFIPHNYANTISVPKDLPKEQKEELQKKYSDKKIPKKELNFVEYGSYRDCSPYESGEALIKSLVEKKRQETKAPLKIQDSCIKLKVDWLGNISKA